MEDKKSKQSKPKSKRRIYSEEFKLEAVRLSQEKNVKEAAQELGIAQPTLSKWRKAILDPKAKPNAKSLSYEELLARNKKLEKEMGYLKDINDVLKKSTAIFSKDHWGDSE